MKTSSLRFAACSCLLAFPPLQGQTSPGLRQGPASSLAAGLMVASSNPDQTLVKAPLNQTSWPPAWDRQLFPSGPDYSIAAMFGMFGTALVANIRLGSESTGNDSIPRLDANGVPLVQANQTWMGVTVSVTTGTMGATGSVIYQRRNRVNPPVPAGADLFTYYYDGSQGIDPRLVDATVLEQSSQQLGLSGTVDVDGLDFGLGMISHARGTTTTILFTNETDFFFTLTRACLVTLPSSFMPGGKAPDATTIYRITWDASAGTAGAWLAPSIYRDALDLGLDPAEDEIDAIAVDPVTESTIFSTTRFPWTTAPSQLMVHGHGPTGDYFHGVLLNNHGVPVANKLGLLSNDITEDIDALCVTDPERQFATLLATAIGTVKNPPFSEIPMGLSVCRSRSPAPQLDELLHVQITGWGPNAPADSIVVIQYSFDAAPIPTNWTDYAWLWRPSTSDNLEATFVIPHGFYANPTTLMAVSKDVNYNVAETWMCRLKLDTPPLP